MRKSLDISALILYCGLIYWLSDQSTLPTPDLFENEDKLHHLLAYAVMGGFAWRAFRHLSPPNDLLFLATLGFCSVYGITDEWHQTFVVGRTPSIFDWLADSIGGLLAAAGCFAYEQKKRRDCK